MGETKEREKLGLHMSVPISARLTSTFGAVKHSLSAYPGVSLVQDGTILRYQLNASEASSAYYVELARDYILIEVFSDTSPIYLMESCLVKLLSVCSMLRGEYVFKIESLFPYIIYALESQKIDALKASVAAARQDYRYTDIILAKRIMALSFSIGEKDKAISLLEGTVAQLTADMIIMLAASGAVDGTSLHAKYGISIDALKRSLEIIRSAGYRIIYKPGGKFVLVRQ
ncbi:MAG: hypothetical protein ACP5TK_02120 [Candidatus Micrarchaeia archaeon]